MRCNNNNVLTKYTKKHIQYVYIIQIIHIVRIIHNTRANNTSCWDYKFDIEKLPYLCEIFIMDLLKMIYEIYKTYEKHIRNNIIITYKRYIHIFAYRLYILFILNIAHITFILYR